MQVEDVQNVVHTNLLGPVSELSFSSLFIDVFSLREIFV